MKCKQVLALLLVIFLLCGCNQTQEPEVTQPQLGVRVDAQQVIADPAPAGGQTVTLIGEYTQAFLEDYHFGKGPETAANQNTVQLKKGPTYRDVTFSWTCEVENTGYTLAYARNADFSDVITVDTQESSIKVPGLYAASTYYWQVVTHAPTGDNFSAIYTFQTADTPRIIYIPGVVNTRDLGGYLTADGKHRVVQGMIYRGANLDSITGEGMETAVKVFKIKTDLDLRNTGNDSMLYTDQSPILMGDVQYFNISGVSYSSALPVSGIMRKELEVFTHAENYPIYFHCAAGRDRAGTLAFMLGALLGVPKETLLADYEMTYLSTMAYAAGDMRGHNNMTAFLEKFDLLEGETTQQKAENYCKNIGLTQEQIDAIRSIMLEEVQ